MFQCIMYHIVFTILEKSPLPHFRADAVIFILIIMSLPVLRLLRGRHISFFIIIYAGFYKFYI